MSPGARVEEAADAAGGATPAATASAQLHAGKRQRVDARGEIGIDSKGLKHLHQSGSAKIRLPRRSSEVFEAVLMNTAGGLTGNDRLIWQAHAGTGSRMALSTAASEKLYRTHGPAARQDTLLSVDENALLAWLPQETILFDDSALVRRLDVNLAPGARLLACESFVFGRQAMGETLCRLQVRDDWRIRRSARLLHAESFRFQGDWSRAAPCMGVAHEHGASATVLYCAELGEEALRHRASAAQQLINADDHAGISVLPERMVIRLLARNGLELRRMLIPLLEILEPEISLPKVWSV